VTPTGSNRRATCRTGPQASETVAADLEPEWTVVWPGVADDEQPVKGSKREAFGLFRIDDRVDAHLRWGRGSALTMDERWKPTSSLAARTTVGAVLDAKVTKAIRVPVLMIVGQHDPLACGDSAACPP
jgi:pimeloyl-ACP methyl ester carboxylesterase